MRGRKEDDQQAKAQGNTSVPRLIGGLSQEEITSDRLFIGYAIRSKQMDKWSSITLCVLIIAMIAATTVTMVSYYHFCSIDVECSLQ